MLICHHLVWFQRLLQHCSQSLVSLPFLLRLPNVAACTAITLTTVSVVMVWSVLHGTQFAPVTSDRNIAVQAAPVYLLQSCLQPVPNQSTPTSAQTALAP